MGIFSCIPSPLTQSFLGESYYPPPHKRLLTRVRYSFPIVLLARQSNQSPLRHCLMMWNQINRYSVRFCISHDCFSSEMLVFPVRRFYTITYHKSSNFLTERCWSCLPDRVHGQWRLQRFSNCWSQCNAKGCKWPLRLEKTKSETTKDRTRW